MATRAELVYKAKLAENAERYEDMANFMKEVANYGVVLNNEERNMLSVAFKNVVGPLRAGHRIITSIEDAEKQKGNSAHQNEITAYKDDILDKLKTVCNEINELIYKTLLKNEDTDAGKVFYYKMDGDYSRYLAEIQDGSECEASADAAKEAYKKAVEIARDSMVATNPIRLGLALNFSVFYYEIMNNSSVAIDMAQTAFDEAMSQLDVLDEEAYKDSTLIMQLLKDNLNLWNGDEGNEKTAQADLEVEDL